MQLETYYCTQGDEFMLAADEQPVGTPSYVSTPDLIAKLNAIITHANLNTGGMVSVGRLRALVQEIE